MKKLLLLLLLTPCFGVLAQNQPVAPVKIVVDEYFGQKIEDPYRYLEDLKEPDVDQWFKGQGDYARGVLDKIKGRDQLLAKFREFDKRQNYSVYNLRITENDLYFYQNTNLSNVYGEDGHKHNFSIYVFGKHKINITSSHAEVGTYNGKSVGYIQIFLSNTEEREILNAIKEIKKLQLVQGKIKFYRILDDE